MNVSHAINFFAGMTAPEWRVFVAIVNVLSIAFVAAMVGAMFDGRGDE